MCGSFYDKQDAHSKILSERLDYERLLVHERWRRVNAEMALKLVQKVPMTEIENKKLGVFVAHAKM